MSGPAFGTGNPFNTQFNPNMTAAQLAEALTNSDLANMSYQELVNRLTTDLALALPLNQFTGAETLMNATAPIGSKPAGADVANNNITGSPSQMALLTEQTITVADSWTLLGMQDSYDPNGWWDGTGFALPKGCYKIEWSTSQVPLTLNAVWSSGHGYGNASAVIGEWAGAGGMQKIVNSDDIFTQSGSQLVLVSSPDTLVPYVATAGCSVAIDNYLWIVTRIN